MKKKRPAKRPHSRRPSAALRALAGAGAPSAELVNAMMMIVGYRFGAFRRAFGRDPRPDEPLFFVEGLSQPVLAERAQLRVQLSEAASATGVELQKLLEFLRLR